MTVFLTTHNLAEADRLCDLVGVIRGGRLIAVGPPAELRRRSGGRRVEFEGRGFSADLIQSLESVDGVLGTELGRDRLVVRLSSEVRVPGLVDLLVRGGAELEEVRKESASLEEAFLTLMEET